MLFLQKTIEVKFLRSLLCMLIVVALGTTVKAQYPNPNNFHTASNGVGGTLPVFSFDLNWEVGLGTFTSLPLSWEPATVSGDCAVGAWYDPLAPVNSNVFNTSNWISYDFGELDPSGNPSPCRHFNFGNQDVYFKTEFDLPSDGPCGGDIASSFCFAMDYMADNNVYEVIVNGNVAFTNNTSDYGIVGFNYLARKSLLLCEFWQAGTNEIVIHVLSTPNFVGFLAQARIPILPINPQEIVCISRDTIDLLLTAPDFLGTIDIDDVDIGSYSPCNFAFSREIDQMSFDCGDIGLNDVTLTLTYLNNPGVPQTAQCGTVVRVSVEDDIDPTCNVEDITVNLDALNQAFITAQDIDNGSVDNCSDVTLSINQASFDCSNIGINEVTLTVTDASGNTSTCISNVTVRESVPPVCSALNNDIVINLLPSRCDTAVTFALPLGTDNCTPAPISSVLVGQPASGDRFTVGTHTVEYLLTDLSGNMTICSFDIIVNDFINPSLGCKPVQLSLDENCTGLLTPTNVLTGWDNGSGVPQLGCDGNYEINIIGTNGELLGDTADRSLLGKTLDYTITYGDVPLCWNTVTIEDKIAPTITCRDITVNCLEDITNLGLPIVTDNCNATAVLVNEVHAMLQCDPLYAGTVTRTWKAVDDYGNESAVCTSVVYIERSDLRGVTGPTSDTLVCNSGFATDDRGFGYPSPSVTGVPTYLGSPIYPLALFNMTFCNAVIDYTDQLVINTACKKRILRTWTITEWWCSTAITYNMPPQFIDIIDNVAPVIPAVADITVTTQTRSCDAAVQLPVLNITDNCTQVYNVYINAVLDGNAVGFVQGNGGLMTLGVGVNEITYTAIDECGNTTTMSYDVTVRDNTDPVAICDQHTTVSLKTNGYTEVTASAVDDGSFDECGAVTLKIRRMEDPCDFGADTAWFDKVGFCCADANTTRMVQLLVTDAGGNTNICMVSVQVQDKVNPTIECPGDLTIEDCLFTFDPSPAGADAAFGEAIITDNCPANNIINQTLEDNRNQCGIGTVERTITVIGGGVTFGTCAQTITFINDEPFLGSSITWPKDYTALGQCSFDGLEPETLPDSSSVPLFTEDACDLVGMRYDDQIFPFTTNGACYKIIRTWTVIDWCQKNSDGTNVTWSYEQEIKVMDNDAPTLTVSDTTVIFETLACSTGLVTLTASAIDCTPAADLKWNYIITQGANVIATGTTNTVVDSFEVGEYTISFTVEDRCGNLAADAYDFEVVTLKAPTATCHYGLSAPLVLMDTDGNGTGDTPMLMLFPDFFDNKSSHACGYDLRLSFSADVNDTLRVFDCTDLGEQEIQLWVTDENGNTSFCATYVDVQDNNNVCPSTLVGIITGKTIKENNEVIQDVTLELKGGEANPVNTNYDGNYAFTPMNTGGDYQVIPGKDGDDVNGISTLDLVMIQRHILGIEKLKSPYKLIAADANNSGKITAADLIDIRKLILGVNASFPSNTSWRFVDAGFVFPDATNPWMTPFDEKYNINNLSGDMNIDFIGVKIGDVNDNAKGRNISGGDLTSRSNQVYNIADRQVSRGEIIEIPVTANTAHMIYGMQMSLESNDVIIRDIREGALQISSEDFVLEGSEVAMSVAVANGKSVAERDVLFTIEVEVLRSGKLSDFLQLSNKVKPEVYMNADIETKAFAIDFRTSSEGVFALVGNHPNPWNSNTTVTFEIPTDGMVSFKVKDYTGRKVVSQINQFNAGVNTIDLQKADLIQSGVYIYEIKFGDKVLYGKMILID